MIIRYKIISLSILIVFTVFFSRAYAFDLTITNTDTNAIKLKLISEKPKGSCKAIQVGGSGPSIVDFVMGPRTSITFGRNADVQTEKFFECTVQKYEYDSATESTTNAYGCYVIKGDADGIYVKYHARMDCPKPK